IHTIEAESLGPDNLAVVKEDELGEQRYLVANICDPRVENIVHGVTLEEGVLVFAVVSNLNRRMRGYDLETVEGAEPDRDILDQRCGDKTGIRAAGLIAGGKQHKSWYRYPVRLFKRVTAT